ncbi:metal ABC transporter ATP-binding protein [Pseudomonas extremorientalis]|uniref:Manganese ABC transporter ATP-binding protein n=1 Tax=Pseudomonas extremorientalis TaxID=169669 RepID=A0A1H0SZK4_9PSED|nr:ATP-binding cassette domain-containing protein [Pseudomonas extremorientalis]KAB0518091.1 ATP-binding cassette domain-containing protein [Pseudomonas extremorientalis]OIN06894.1 manganese ABC transporter ATP-binding protein [Pseudomonas extremorientalis]UUN88766.1 ATP-binding cassette domain-containing protein [Pseudomonas extremorientalis]WLG56884.1 ATP-binding cassette domain-containing protein [Pseudomonas extremorientalis]SDP47144.1 zinc/manganese transport system ATP-binding protein [P
MITCTALRWGAPGQPLTPALDLTLEKGSLTGIIGANGTGKSSLLKVIAGLQKPLAGKVTVAVPRRGGLSFLPQQQHLDRQFPISLQELVAAGFWGTQLSPQQRSQRLEAVLEDWCLSGLEHRPLMALSGGELQRALLARMSLAEAPVLLLDEPHAALDEEGQALCWKHIHAWHDQGRTLIVVCHDLASVRHHTQHVVQIKNTGCLFGPSKELIRPQPQMQVA